MSLHNMYDKLNRAQLPTTGQMLNVPGVGVLLGYGTTVGNSIQGWAKGALFLDVDAATGAQFWINVGTSATASWKGITSLDAANTWALLQTFTTGINTASLQIGSVTVNSTAAEIDRVADKSASVITNTATTLSITVTQHASRTVVLSCATTSQISLPVASGSGEKFVFIIGATSTDGNKVIAANGTDIILGNAIIATPSDTDTAKILGFTASATSDKLTFNGTTSGGRIGDVVELIDYAANTWNAKVIASGSTNTGGPATPFSQT